MRSLSRGLLVFKRLQAPVNNHGQPLNCNSSWRQSLDAKAATKRCPVTPASHVARTDVSPHAESASEQHGIQSRDEATSEPPSLLAQSPRDLWLEAFEKLPKEIHGQLNLNDSTQKPLLQQIQELSSLAKLRQEECEKQFWKLRVGDHEIVLRDYAVTIIDGLRKIGDIAIQFAPPQASIPWSAMKILMQVCLRVWRGHCLLLC